MPRIDPAQAQFQTHEVTNMPPALTDYDLFTTDRALVDATSREGAAGPHPGVGAPRLKIAAIQQIKPAPFA